MDERKLNRLSRRIIEEAESPEFNKTGELSSLNRVLSARDEAENLLAQQVLKNTGVPIPSKYASNAKFEDFLNRIMKERYPELSPDVNLIDLSKDNAKGLYWRGKTIPSWIEVANDLKKNPIEAVGTMLHEAGHQFDDKVLNAPRGKDLVEELVPVLEDLNPAHIYEQISKGHHVEIPNLRQGSYGKGALKSLLNYGKFRAIAPYLAGGAGLALSAVSEAADAEPVGGAWQDRQMDVENKQNKLRKLVKSRGGDEALQEYEALPQVKAQDLIQEQDNGPKLKKLSKLLGR